MAKLGEMSEQEWLSSQEPTRMLAFLHNKASDRKLRLFACACCRCVWHLLTDRRSRHAVAVAERYVDGLTSRAEMKSVHKSSSQVATRLFRVSGREASGAASAASMVSDLDWPTYSVALQVTLETCLHLIDLESFTHGTHEAQKAARLRLLPAQLHQADLVRDMFGPLPFHPIEIDSSWLSWNDGIVPKLAEAIYDDRAFDRLPILADALGEAGCTNADILNHCRQPGEHVRGCWVVDLLLGKS